MSNSNIDNKLKLVQGRVVSDKMDKTRVVLVEIIKKHPLFHKALRRSRKIHVHDEKNESNVGDLVKAVEARPLSKTKRYRLYSIMERAK